MTEPTVRRARRDLNCALAQINLLVKGNASESEFHGPISRAREALEELQRAVQGRSPREHGATPPFF